MMRGGRPTRHLERPIDDRPFLSPAPIDTTDMAERPDIELFGPVLQVIRAHDFDAAIAEANNTRYGLSASLISQNPALYNRFWANARAGIVNWNKPTNGARSEEHTSELQSLMRISYAVFCLKKKQTKLFSTPLNTPTTK